MTTSARFHRTSRLCCRMFVRRSMPRLRGRRSRPAIRFPRSPSAAAQSFTWPAGRNTSGCERRESRATARRRSEQRRSFLCERRRLRRILDVRAADLQEEMPEQRFSVPSATTKTAATSEHRSERSAQSILRDARAAQASASTQRLSSTSRWTSKSLLIFPARALPSFLWHSRSRMS